MVATSLYGPDDFPLFQKGSARAVSMHTLSWAAGQRQDGVSGKGRSSVLMENQLRVHIRHHLHV